MNIVQIKYGRKRLAHNTEHFVDIASLVIVGVTVQGSDARDTNTPYEIPTSTELGLRAASICAGMSTCSSACSSTPAVPIWDRLMQ